MVNVDYSKLDKEPPNHILHHEAAYSEGLSEAITTFHLKGSILPLNTGNHVDTLEFITLINKSLKVGKTVL